MRFVPFAGEALSFGNLVRGEIIGNLVARCDSFFTLSSSHS
jgi:hypothetical protein